MAQETFVPYKVKLDKLKAWLEVKFGPAVSREGKVVWQVSDKKVKKTTDWVVKAPERIDEADIRLLRKESIPRPLGDDDGETMA